MLRNMLTTIGADLVIKLYFWFRAPGLVKISKLRVRRHFEAEVGQYFAADVVLNFRLVEILIWFGSLLKGEEAITGHRCHKDIIAF